MKLIACRNPGPNFGDDLNHVLWPALEPELFDPDSRDGFLGIGTIVGMPTPGVERLHVFSSGVGYDPVETWRTPRRIWCVRGPLSARALKLDPAAALTDGAVLVPELLAAEPPPPAGPIVVVPHWQSLVAPGWTQACALAGFELVSPAADDPLSVCRALRGARRVLTESLHGAIVADAFGVPWTAFASSGNFSLFKWADWCASVGVPLAPALVPPPSSRAWARFGRPRWNPAAGPLDEAAAWADYRARAAAAAPGRGAGVGARLKSIALGSALVGRALGLSPARTAEALVRAAAAEPVVSAPGRRAALAGAMRERFAALARGRSRAVQTAVFR